MVPFLLAWGKRPMPTGRPGCRRRRKSGAFRGRRHPGRYAGVWGALAPQRVQGGALPAGGIPLPSRTVDAAKSDPHEHPFNEEPPHADRAARRRSGPKKRSVSVRNTSGTLRRGLGGGSPPSGCRAAPCPPEAFLLFLPSRSTRSRCGSGPEGGPWRDCARRAGRCALEAP